MKRGNYWHSFAVIAIFVLLLSGCGKKGDPIPGNVVPPKVISDLVVEYRFSEQIRAQRQAVVSYNETMIFRNR